MAAIGDATSTVKGWLPDVNLSGKLIFGLVTWVIIVIIILILIGVGAYFIIRARKFNNKIILFKKINNIYQPIRKDRASEIKFSTAGDTIFYARKNKKYLPVPTFQTGNRTFWYHIREDGEWINFKLGDLDEIQRTMGAKFLDKEARFARTAIQKGLKERYDAPGFWKQYGLLIISIVYIVIIGMMVWLALDKFIEIISKSGTVIDHADQVMLASEKIINALANIQTGGSGYIPAT